MIQDVKGDLDLYLTGFLKEITALRNIGLRIFIYFGAQFTSQHLELATDILIKDTHIISNHTDYEYGIRNRRFKDIIIKSTLFYLSFRSFFR